MPPPSMAVPSAVLRVVLGVAALAVHAGAQPKSTNIKYHEGISREDKWKHTGHKGITLWMTGMSGSGKSTISVALENALVSNQPKSYFVYRLDGDNLRFGLNRDLGFAPADRKENVRRVAEVAKLFAEAGAIVICGLISPYKADREFAREVHVNASLPFMEVYAEASIEALTKRDPKGLWKKALAGEIKGFTGLDAPYEAPENAEVHVKTETTPVPEAVNMILAKLDEVGINLPRTFRPVSTEPEGSCESK
ncbi:unnamed protein product [Prorocentrum cordatum]|uniref:Adenylyl-sulfate kinase n=1 Tax=Prorocentrum cordatum TaxID=2364126 RepID=A0ABN9SHM9_9DINO|nr:unnamed protein product [Polarella glacialis]